MRKQKIKPYKKILYIEGRSVDPRFLQTLTDRRRYIRRKEVEE